MFYRRSPTRFLTLLVILGLVLFGASAIQRNAWTQGYLMGQLAVSGIDGATLPLEMAQAGYGGGPSFFGLLFGLGFLFLLLMIAGRVLRFWMWRGAGGPGFQEWARQWQDRPGAGCWPGHHDERSRNRAETGPTMEV